MIDKAHAFIAARDALAARESELQRAAPGEHGTRVAIKFAEAVEAYDQAKANLKRALTNARKESNND